MSAGALTSSLGLWRCRHQPGSADTDQRAVQVAPCVGDRPAGGAGGSVRGKERAHGFRRLTGPTSLLHVQVGDRRAGV